MSRIASFLRRLRPDSAIDSARTVFAFGSRNGAASAPARSAAPRGRTANRESAKRTQSVHALAVQGFSIAEIARRTRISQDAVTMLLNLVPERPAESAADGTFFRILQARTAA